MAVLTTDAFSFTQSGGWGALLPSAVYTPPASVVSNDVWVEILDGNLISKGPVQFVNVTAQLFYNAVGSWSLVAPYSDTLWNLVMSGDFMVSINWRGLFSIGGKCEKPGYTDSIPGTSGSSAGSGPFITMSGADWLGLIANKICYPSSGVAWNAQTAGANDPVSSVPLETAIKHYVNNNIGYNSLASRRNTLLDIAADQGRGGTVSYTVKFGTGVNLNLLDVIRALIEQTNTSMGVLMTFNRATHSLLFDVYSPRDLTGKAWFSESLGNLTAVNFDIADPTCTDSLVQGSGTTFIQSTAASRTMWNSVELFNDSSSETDINNLNATAQQALAAGGFGPTMAVTAADIPFLTYGRDYHLGDIVTIEVRPGVTYSDIVTSVTLTADPSQNPSISVVPKVGNDANATATDSSIIGVLSARIRALEKKLANK